MPWSLRRLPAGAKLPLVMLTSLGRREVEASTERFAAYLTKPVKASQLYNTLAEVLMFDTGRQPVHRAEEPSEFDPAMGSRLPLHILLAEDNATNQKLALLLLERLGYRADVAGNGLETLTALQRQAYDVILMDMQMPEMDGLQATEAIRRQMYAAGQPYIIATTANAMQGDRDACLAAGMDDYVSKPIAVAELVAALRRAAESRGVQPHPPAAATTGDPLLSEARPARANVGHAGGVTGTATPTELPSWIRRRWTG